MTTLSPTSTPDAGGASAGGRLESLPLETFDQKQEHNTFEFRALYNPERRSAVFIVPGLCGVILSLTMVLFTGIAKPVALALDAAVAEQRKKRASLIAELARKLFDERLAALRSRLSAPR